MEENPYQSPQAEPIESERRHARRIRFICWNAGYGAVFSVVAVAIWMRVDPISNYKLTPQEEFAAFLWLFSSVVALFGILLAAVGAVGLLRSPPLDSPPCGETTYEGSDLGED